MRDRDPLKEPTIGRAIRWGRIARKAKAGVEDPVGGSLHVSSMLVEAGLFLCAALDSQQPRLGRRPSAAAETGQSLLMMKSRRDRGLRRQSLAVPLLGTAGPRTKRT